MISMLNDTLEGEITASGPDKRKFAKTSAAAQQSWICEATFSNRPWESGGAAASGDLKIAAIAFSETACLATKGLSRPVVVTELNLLIESSLCFRLWFTGQDVEVHFSVTVSCRCRNVTN
jgi:hypothetical protein